MPLNNTGASESPCIGICRMQDGLCLGCRRTLDEIARWAQAGKAEKQAILDACQARIQAEIRAGKQTPHT